MPITIHLIAAARPNFMKIAPLYHELTRREWARPVIVHTGQHYDQNMSDAFFQDLELPTPHIHLEVGSGSHAEQTGNVLIAYEKILLTEKPDIVVVVGDVNSTIACTLAAAKIHYSTDPADRPIICHLEAGLRSNDRSMPEEINRLATDVLSDFLWTPSYDADENLQREGIAPEKIVRVGNIMIDSLELMRAKIEPLKEYAKHNLKPQEYGVVTLHRPANVDDPKILKSLCDALIEISTKIPLIMPVHPRTKKNLVENNLWDELADTDNLHLVDPLGYKNFMSLIFNCKLVITDSGGIQEETTYLGIPCLTLRPNTERPVTITDGTNKLSTIAEILIDTDEALKNKHKRLQPPDLWDGKTAARIADAIVAITKDK
jgi:UDP-N-acetylglucosamine 2-epimerase (non-hydrolysing)